MLNHISRLNYLEKLYLIESKCNFSLSTRVQIEFNEKIWMDEIKTYIHPDKIDKSKEYINDIFNCKSIKSEINSDDFRNIRKFITSSPIEFDISDRDEGSGYIKSYLDCVELFQKCANLIGNVNSKKNIVNFIIKEIIPWKLNGYKIISKCNTENAPNDKLLLDNILNEPKRLFCSIVEASDGSVKFLSVLIYLFLQSTNMQEYPLCIPKLLNNANLISDKKSKEIVDTISTIDKENISEHIAEIIDSGKVSNLSVSDNLIENYDKNNMSTEVDSFGLIIGDSIFDDELNLFIEIDKLMDDIDNYVDSSVDLQLDEDQIGYLRVRERVPMCKLLKRDGKFITLIKYEDNPFMMYKTHHNLMGISFPSKEDGTRKIIKFEVPTKLKYSII